MMPEVIGVIGLVRQQAPWRGDIVKQSGSGADVGDVAGRQDEGGRLALSIGQNVDFACLNIKWSEHCYDPIACAALPPF
jgi:hypothetical protein